MEPTTEQDEAMDAVMASLERDREAVLTGAAGTGKTTAMRWLLDRIEGDGWGVVLGTPTGKACVRLSEVTKRQSGTLHAHLYQRVEDGEDDAPRFMQPGPVCDSREVFVCDEASMVGSEIYGHVMQHLPSGARVLWVGDREQLEPVRDTWGPNLSEPTANLQTVHRQAAGNPIISYATAIRHGAMRQWRQDYRAGALGIDPGDERLQLTQGGSGRATDWLMGRLEAGREDAVVLTFTHRVREAVNAQARARLGFQRPIEVGDRLLCRMNDYIRGMMNGEVFTVTHVEDAKVENMACWRVHFAERTQAVHVVKDLLNHRGQELWKLRRSLRKERWEKSGIGHFWHGFCLTVHSAQGSQWDDVAFVVGNAVIRKSREEPDFARRLCYTAATRAAERLTVFDMRGAS